MFRSRRVLAALLAPALTLALVSPAGAKAHPSLLPLPDDFAPEGIAAAGRTFYAGSLVDGDIYRGSLHSGKGSVFIDVTCRQAAGLKVDRWRGLLWVAGGFTGHAYVYDLHSGADVADFDLGGGLVNDVVVTRRAAYFTETFAPAIYMVPIRRNGSLGTPRTITVTGPAGTSVPDTFGLNGIEATPHGRRLIVAHTDLAKLFKVNPRTGASKEIVVLGGTLTPGTLDGILRVGRRVWIVENFANRLTRVKVSRHWTRARVEQTVTHPLFQVPTTVARHGGRLVVVNGKFDLGFPPPIGPGAPPGTPFEAVQFRP